MPVRDRPAEVLPTSEARRTLSQTARCFAQLGAEADPVFFGAHRKPTGVILSFERYMQLLDRLDDLAIVDEVRKRDARDTGGRVGLADLLAAEGIDREEALKQSRST